MSVTSAAGAAAAIAATPVAATGAQCSHRGKLRRAAVCATTGAVASTAARQVTGASLAAPTALHGYEAVGSSSSGVRSTGVRSSYTATSVALWQWLLLSRCVVFTRVSMQVIELNVSTAAVDPQKTRDISDGDSFDIEYSYSVKWKAVTIKFSDRMDRYSRYSFLPQHLEVGR